MAVNKEELLEKRLLELANTAYYRKICTYTDFLNLNEQNIFLTKVMPIMPQIIYSSWGGYDNAERTIFCFRSEDAFLEPKYPLHIIRIAPINSKFSDILTHRDYLGALSHLGIKREKIGDIIIDNHMAYVFLHEHIKEFVLDELRKVKHTYVSCEEITDINFKIEPSLKQITGFVSSVRLDGVLSVAFKESRTKLTDYIRSKKVFVNSKLMENNSYVLKEGDVVSVRGMGKFIFQGIEKQSKKGRYCITVQKYI